MKKFFANAVLGLCTFAFLSGSGMAAPVQADGEVSDFAQANNAAVSDYLQAGNKVEMSFQVVSVSDIDVQSKINTRLFQRAEAWQNDIKEILQNGDALSTSLNSVVTYQDKGIISIKTDEYFYVDHAAHPMSWTYGNVFSLSDGKELSLEDIAALPKYKEHAQRYTWSSVKHALIAKYGDMLFSHTFNLTEVPKDVYIDADSHVHVMIQRYELAPYAAGLLDVDLDAE